MQYNVSLVESDAVIIKRILEALVPLVQQRIDKALPKIDMDLKNVIRNAIASQQEYRSLTSSNGQLRLEFGIADPGLVDRAIDALVATSIIKINKVKSVGARLTGGFSISFMPDNAVLSVSQQFSVITEKGTQLPWLQWLLFYGISSIVKDYDVVFEPNPNSRTGGAIMRPSSSAWRVPPEYAGVPGNNWITKAVDDLEKPIIAIFNKYI